MTPIEQINAALDEQDAAHLRRQTLLMDSGVDMALLDGDADRAAALLLRKADLEGGGQAAFDDLRSVQNTYYEQGRDKGTSIDLRVSIALAHLITDRGTTPDEKGAALNVLGNALATLGARDSDSARLEQAVAAYTEAQKSPPTKHTSNRSN